MTQHSDEPDRTGPRIEVVEDKTGKVIHCVKLYSANERHAEKVEAGLSINLDHERFSTRIVLEDSEES